jgi:hypothetical protein
MLEDHFEAVPWLLDKNLPSSNSEGFKGQSKNNGVLSEGIGDPGESEIIRFETEIFREHIEKWLGKEVNTYFKGIEEIEVAIDNGQIREGQLIFEEVKISRMTFRGSGINCIPGPEGPLCDILASAFSKFYVNQSRDFAFFHVAVYVGCYDGTHYVIENGGQEDPRLHQGKEGHGTITVCPLANAFSSKSSFFVVSPRRDENDFTKRYMVMQRSLVAVGVEYNYHIKAVTCESFALMMIGLFEKSQAIQHEVLRSHRKDLSEDEQSKAIERNSERYKAFYDDVVFNIKNVKTGVILTLDFLIKACLESNPLGSARNRLGFKDTYRGSMPTGSSHIEKTTQAYNQLMNAVHLGDWESVIALVNQGLDLKSVTAYGKTALTIAASKGHTAICTALIQGVELKYRADVRHKDNNGHDSLEYAEYLNHTETLNALTDTCEPIDKVSRLSERGFGAE